MRFLNSSSRWSTVLITLFFAAWVWTEVIEYGHRDAFVKEVTAFMGEDNQFNRADGDRLVKIMAAMNRRMDLDEARVERLAQWTHSHDQDLPRGGGD
jgi:hypothetical protein